MEVPNVIDSIRATKNPLRLKAEESVTSNQVGSDSMNSSM